jgi:pimeloyl-ACP methyl ester carboxylesterase
VSRRQGTFRWKRGLGIALLCLTAATIAWVWWAEDHPREERELRILVNDRLTDWFPQEMAPDEDWHGLHLRAQPARSQRVRVLLVHGLDEPGSIWDDLIPALETAGYEVWEFRYPNDQGIDRSAAYLAAQWPTLAEDRLVVLIGHSMGGLVVRDFVSRFRHPVGKSPGVKGPAVAGVMLVGTPNQGSEWARLRVWLELRDQFATGQGRRFSLFAALRDGTGEAKIDLRPGSEFLQELNARPWPASVPILVIAGRLLAPSPDLSAGLDAAATEVGSSDLRRTLEAWWSGIGEGLGDGVVTLDSAGLRGGPRPVVLNASHRGMLVRLLPTDPEPPAIAPIRATLHRWAAERAGEGTE